MPHTAMVPRMTAATVRSCLTISSVRSSSRGVRNVANAKPPKNIPAVGPAARYEASAQIALKASGNNKDRNDLDRSTGNLFVARVWRRHVLVFLFELIDRPL